MNQRCSTARSDLRNTLKRQAERCGNTCWPGSFRNNGAEPVWWQAPIKQIIETVSQKNLGLLKNFLIFCDNKKLAIYLHRFKRRFFKIVGK
jgi:hypothetical protein